MTQPLGATGAIDYMDSWTVLGLGVGLAVAVLCTIAGLNGRPPGRVTIGAIALVQATVLLILGVYLWRVLDGQSPVGPSWELWSYLVTVVMLPALAWIWARQEHSRWSTLVLALASFVAAVMLARSAQIWYGVGFG